MKQFLVIGAALALPLAAQAAASHVTERHCGWLENPTAANYFFNEDGVEYTLAVQGGYQAKGIENLPAFDPSQFEATNGNYGRSCACLDVDINLSQHSITYVAGGENRPLSECRGGAAAPEAPSYPAPVQPSAPWRDPGNKAPVIPSRPVKPVPAPVSPTPAPVAPVAPSPDYGQKDPGYNQKDPGYGQKDGPQDPGYGQKDPGYGQKDPGVPAPAAAEIQIFVNYRGYNNYDYKYVSNFDQTVSALILYPNPATQNGACYMGDPQSAIGVFQNMVDRMNAEVGSDTAIQGNVFTDPNTGKPALEIDGMTRGIQFVWFPRIRMCDRWSTDEERSHNPNN